MRTNSHQLKEYKKTLKLTKDQRSIIVGTLLGDAHLETQDKGCTYRAKFAQCVAHKPYLEHLAKIFKEWVLTLPKFKESNRVWHSNTVSHGALRFFGHQFYTATGVKRVPKLIHRWLTPMALAYWFMDDGSMKSKQSKGVIFNTQGFSLEDIKRLCELLYAKFNLRAWPRRQRKKPTYGTSVGGPLPIGRGKGGGRAVACSMAPPAGAPAPDCKARLGEGSEETQLSEYYQIYVSGHSYEQLKSLIYPYLLPEMLYKFPSPRSARKKISRLTQLPKE